MKKVPHQFPWRHNNKFSLLMNGEVFYKDMLESIGKAKHFILFETYFIESGIVTEAFFNALALSKQKGIQLFLLVDDFGVRHLSEKDKRFLKQENIEPIYFNPINIWKLKKIFYRDHRKLLLVDNEVAYVGGAGLSDQFIGKKAWRDNMVKIQGFIVNDWYQLFELNWQQHSKIKLPQKQDVANFNEQYHALGKLTYSQGFIFNEIKKALFNHITGSRIRIWITSAYFMPSIKLRRHLCKAAQRGVDVRLLVPGRKTDNPMIRYIGQTFYTKLLKNKVRIFEYQDHFIHSKLILIDSWVSMGSSNMDTWGGYWNLEANQEILDLDFSEKMKHMMLNDFNQCKEIDFSGWCQRSRIQKLKGWFWKKIAKVLHNIRR